MATTATKKRKIYVKEGKIYVLTSYNNTIVTVTDMKGNVIASSSAGANGFKGARKGTTYASGVVAATASQKAKEMGMERVDVYVNGPGSGRESALRSVQGAGIRVSSVRDITPIPHN
ncbi:MAG: 30S ribosomal protein S11, partial [Elusimicrobiota bacterium]|nr:30S ribosomal protein S11 [Elusimicrobiota bacterium]